LKTLLLSLLILTAIGLGACTSPVPVAQDHKLTRQLNMRTAEHWDLLAASVAERLNSRLATTDSAGDKLMLYVEKPVPGSEFDRGFHDLLITRLLERGYGVTDSRAASALTVNYDIQVIRHNNDLARGFLPTPRTATPTYGQPIGYIDGTGGQIVGFTDRNSYGFYRAPDAVDYTPDYAVRAVPAPFSEIIVTTSIVDASGFIDSMNDIYYISDVDRSQYLAGAPASARRMEVVGDEE